MEVAEISFRNWVFHIEAATGEYITCRLIEDETERAGIPAHSTGIRHIQELDIPILIDPEFESLRTVVHPGRNDRIREIQIKSLKDFQQAASLLETLGLLVILAIYLKHVIRFKCYLNAKINIFFRI